MARAAFVTGCTGVGIMPPIDTLVAGGWVCCTARSPAGPRR